MVNLVRFFSVFLFLLGVSISRAEISPVSLTFFGLYGSPVDPPALAVPSANGMGFNALAEWQATTYTSIGLGFEQASFSGGSTLTVPMFNLEGRFFPMENERRRFSPYIYGGAGLNLASAGAWQGPVQLKAGIGSRVSIAGPIFFDLAVGSHWLQPPNNFQFVDIRYGLSMSFGFKEGFFQSQSSGGRAPENPPAKQPEKQNPTPKSAGTVGPTPTVNWTPIPTPIVSESQAATIVIESAPVTTLAGVKKYYKLGMKAFLGKNYALSLKLLKKSLASREIHGASYYYAETYATMGVIYQFHAHKVKDHNLKALDKYRKALAIDPDTKSAKAYYKKLKAQVAREKKAALKTKVHPKTNSITEVTPTASDDSSGTAPSTSAPPKSGAN